MKGEKIVWQRLFPKSRTVRKVLFVVGIFLWATMSAVTAILGVLMSSASIIASFYVFAVAPFVGIFPLGLVVGLFVWPWLREDAPKNEKFRVVLKYFLPMYLIMIPVIVGAHYSHELFEQRIRQHEEDEIMAYNESLWDLREARQTAAEEFFSKVDTFAECNSPIHVHISSLWIDETSQESVSDSSFIAEASCTLENRDGSVLRDADGFPQSTFRSYFVMFEGSELRSVYEATPTTKEDAQASVPGDNQINYLKQTNQIYP